MESELFIFWYILGRTASFIKHWAKGWYNPHPLEDRSKSVHEGASDFIIAAYMPARECITNLWGSLESLASFKIVTDVEAVSESAYWTIIIVVMHLLSSRVKLLSLETREKSRKEISMLRWGHIEPTYFALSPSTFVRCSLWGGSLNQSSQWIKFPGE